MNSLRDLGPKVKWGVDVNQALDEATATDPNTVVLKFKIPSPRFFFFATYKYDIGIYIVPKHIFQGQDWTTFKHFDIAKGWPVTTGPWKVAASSLQQKVFERRDTWWAAEQKLAPMPQILRNIWLPMVGEQKTAQAQITNQVGLRRRPAARDLPDRDPAEPQDHLVFRAEAAVGLCRLVADLALRQQRGQAVRRQGRALGGQPLHRSPADHRGRLSRRRDGLDAADAALQAAAAVFRRGEGPAREIQHHRVQPEEGRRAAGGQGVQEARRHVGDAGRQAVHARHHRLWRLRSGDRARCCRRC